MACECCAASRTSRTYDPRCLWCGARYAWYVRTRTDLQLPAQVAGQEMSRRQWFDHVIETWAKHGHDPERLKELAREEKPPREPRQMVSTDG
jgi:hypothetical protein